MSIEHRNFIDYFAVCGLDIKSGLESETNEANDDNVSKSPLERSYKCKILNHFPSNLPWNPFDDDAVTQLCLPNGLKFQKHNSKPRFHPFIITREDGSRVHGGTLTFFELIEDESICNAMQTLQTMYDAEYSNSKSNLSSTIYSMASSRSHHINHHRSASVTNHYLTRTTSPLVTNLSDTTNMKISNKSMSVTTPISTKMHSSKYESSPHSDKKENSENNQYRLEDEVSLLNNTNLIKNSSTPTQTIESNAHENVLKSSNGSYNSKNHQRLSLSNTKPIVANTNQNSNPNNSFGYNSPTKVSHYNTLKDRLYASKCICLISQYPFNKSFFRILHTLFDMVEQTDLLGISLESHLYNLIYEIPIPNEGKLLKFHIGCKANHLYMPEYADGKELPLFDYDLFEFFHLLGVSNMINLYITALLEHQILLYSKDYYLLMLVAECLTSLLFPFTWLKPYVPIVPASNLHFIEAPVPYIMGFHHRDIDKEFFKQGQRCFVDIDSGTVTCPEGLPDFPDKNKFIKELNDLVVYFNNKRNQIRDKKQAKLNINLKHSESPNGKSLKQKINDLEIAIEKFNDSCEDTDSIVSNMHRSDSTYDILQNSQAFARIAELARKAGAIDDYVVDASTGKFKSITRTNTTNIDMHSRNNINNHCVNRISIASSSSSGVSSGVSSESSSLVNNEITNNCLKLDNSISSDANEAVIIGGGVVDEDIINMQFSYCIRELFLQRFVHMFVSYEKFVIVPNLENNQIETWWTNREYSGNFDSKMFLIEQPSPRLPFLSHFISTQMFVSFIDLKIISLIDPQKPPDPNVKIFDERIKQFKENENNNGMHIYDIKVDVHKAALEIKEIENDVIKKMTQSAIIAPTARQLKQKNFQMNNLESTPILLNKRDGHYLFESLDSSLLNSNEEYIKKVYNDIQFKKESLIKKREQFSSSGLKISLDKPTKTHKEKKSRKQNSITNNNNSSNNNHNDHDTSNRSINSNNDEKANELYLNSIIQTLLKESKFKTKRMLVEKMPEAANLGHGEARISGIEENMLIASLCDLIERIWGHGLHGKPGKSALWNHLTSYRKLIQYLHPNSNLIADAKSTPPTLLWCLMKKRASSGLSSNHIFGDKTNHNQNYNNTNTNEPNSNNIIVNNESNFDKSSANTNINNNNNNNNNNKIKNNLNTGSSTLPRKRSNITLTPEIFSIQTSPHISLSRHHTSSSNLHNHHVHQQHKRAQSVNNENHNTFPPLKNDLLGDLSRIDKLTEVKTEIGMARAFVRLSLEKKLLADHLRQLLSEAELLRALYKKHAFLRQEDEREQFIYHLESLNVVDYFCFTNHFRSIPTDYSILIVPSKKFNSSTTSANPYMKLFGSLGESDVFLIPRNNFEFVISCNCNLGPLTTLIIGHDNAGITPKWMIECVFVRNEITGHIHKFPCGRWLGKGVDDDSLERLLIAEPVNHNESYDLPNIQLLSPYHNNTRSRSPTIVRHEEKKLQPPAIQEMLSNSINTLVKFFEKSDSERGSLTNLMCGEYGLVASMENIFSFGYKSYKLFKRLYVWDFLEKVAGEFESISYSNNSSKYSMVLASKNIAMDKYISVIRTINSTSSNYGKDGKFQIFICLSCRDSFLSEWFSLLSQSNTASQMYDEYSFLRNYELNKFCVKILSITNQFNFKLENSLTMGINF